MLESIDRQFICHFSTSPRIQVEEGAVARTEGDLVAPGAAKRAVSTPAAISQLNRLTSASRAAPLFRDGKKPEAQYQQSFQEAQASAKQGDEKAAGEALAKMRYYREAAAVLPDRHGKDEAAVHASLYESTLRFAKEEIAGHSGGGWRKVTRAKDPFIEKNFDRKILFSKLDEYSSKAGISPDCVAENKKQIDGALYEYYQKQALVVGARAIRGDDVEADVEKFVSKLREVGSGAGHSEDQIKADAKKTYRNLFERKLANMSGYVGDYGVTKTELQSDPLFGPKMFELGGKAGIGEKEAAYLRNWLGSLNPGELFAQSVGMLAKAIKRFEAKVGRPSTLNERVEIIEKLPETDPYITYHEWRKSGAYMAIPGDLNLKAKRLGPFDDLGPPMDLLQ